MVGVAAFSHYPLDVLVHLPDLPMLGNDSPKLGLGLWNHPVATMVTELVVFVLGLALYVALRSKRHPIRAGRLAVLVVVLLGTYFASVYGPPPPNMTTVGVERYRLRPAGGSAGRVGGPARLARGARSPASHSALNRWTGCSSRSARCPP